MTCAAQISVPLLAIENSADDAVPQPHTAAIFNAAGSADKTMHVIKGATHYYAGQPDKLAEALTITRQWLTERDLLA